MKRIKTICPACGRDTQRWVNANEIYIKDKTQYCSRVICQRIKYKAEKLLKQYA